MAKKILHVRGYDLFLDLDYRNLKFEGKILVDLDTKRNVILNSLNLNIKKVRAGENSFKFSQNGEDLIVETATFDGKLEIEYSGLISDSLVGIYRAPYNNTYMVTTQFEAANARRMFPCVDRPEHKAEFKLNLRIDKDLDAISNMPIESTKIEDNKKTVTFQKTPRMSTYLLYLGIGRFEEIKERFGKIDIVVASTPGKAKKGVFALEITKKSLEFYQQYFDVSYSLPKVHLISIPEFSASAMENWGAITFREAALEIDERTSFRTRKRVAEVVAHELAHQWFGNLVTMKWWNDLWLNESFATFMAYKVVDSVFPQWIVWEDFLKNETSTAMVRDSLKNTHPIEVNIESPNEIEQIFDEISYSKGANILRMIEEHIGAEDFRKGIRSYIASYKFSNATGLDLWSSLEEASGKQAKKIMKGWIQKSGYPLITVKKDRNRLILKQDRFLLSGKSEKKVWPIPLTIKLNGKSKHLLMEKEEETIKIKDLKSLKVNVDRTGFYRVFYKGLYDLVWRANLSPSDKWAIISDALAFLLATRISLEDYLDILGRYYDEQDVLPAHEISSQMSFLYSIIPSIIAETSKKFHSLQLKALATKTDKNSSMLRGTMAVRLAAVDDNYAKKLGSRFHEYEKVESDMKEAVAVAYARTYGNFKELQRKYRESSSDEDKVRLLGSMMSFKDPSLVARSFSLALNGEVKRQDVGTMVLAATVNPDARRVTWMWLKTNIARLKSLYEGTGKLSRILLSVIPILGIGRVEEVERFFKENMMPEAETGIKAGLEKLKIYDRLEKFTSN